MRKQESLSTGKNYGCPEPDYRNYRLSRTEWLLYAGQGAGYLAVMVYVFYRSAALFLLLLPACILYPVYMRNVLQKRRMEKLSLQFKDAILILASALNAGYSVENAFASSAGELDRIYGEDSMISREIRLILRKVKMNHPIEEAMKNFADRSGLEDVRNFTEVFTAARKSGGELMKIISRTAEIIGEKIRMREEILTMTSARRMEQKIMSAIPILLVIYIEWTSPGFFDILYGTMMGRVIMTCCLGFYCLANRLSAAFLNIEM